MTTMQKRISTPVLLLSVLILAACATSAPNSKEPVSIVFDKEQVRRCQPLGEIVGSKGYWYSSWLVPNDLLITGALDDLKNKARALNADTVFVPEYPLLFATSVTMLGQALRCRNNP